ncbi:hypothetical protein EIN_059620 [Entamoeba invadens IP1]|uniref:hypothetical protein n=1 Tax=Entamoeba invadens IP1 TaxID=370355 RepID=UPI0002C3D76C|nr:hypothetical protein EIN_059620 [Entamoeba invadens IP1]ELP93467.1 hypothetical protein EIN_059620 [Entamoeba invadens IP1]|eukprot:XP_004260238.1 hypothetical protein EIN_059620 [Entamoeba invadens IP1]
MFTEEVFLAVSYISPNLILKSYQFTYITDPKPDQNPLTFQLLSNTNTPMEEPLFMDCDETTCLLSTENKVYQIDITPASGDAYPICSIKERTTLSKTNLHCTPQKTVPTKFDTTAVECVDMDKLYLFKEDGVVEMTSYIYEDTPLISVLGNGDLVMYDGNRVFVHTGMNQLLYNSYKLPEDVLVATNNYVLTKTGIYKYGNTQLNVFTEPVVQDTCVVKASEIVYNTKATLFHPSQTALGGEYINDCIGVVYVDTRFGQNLTPESLSNYNFTFSVGEYSTSMSDLASKGFIRVNKMNVSYDNTITTIFNLKGEEEETMRGFNVYFILNWTTGEHKSSSIYTYTGKPISLRSGVIRYEINNRQYKVNIKETLDFDITQDIYNTENQQIDLVKFKTKTYIQYGELVDINDTNAYLNERKVLQYWVYNSYLYSQFLRDVCTSETTKVVQMKKKGVCEVPTYTYFMKDQTTTTTENVECCNSDTCNTIFVEGVDCKPLEGVVTDVYSSTLVKLALTKKFDFMDERSCFEKMVNQSATGSFFLECVYGNMQTLAECVDNKTVSSCAQVMFSNSADDTKVEKQQVVADSGEKVQLLTATSSISPTSTNIVTPQNMNTDTFKFQVQSILNANGKDATTETPVAKLFFKKMSKVKNTRHLKGAGMELPSIDVDDKSTALLVGDGLTVDNENVYIKDNITVCLEMNEFCSEGISADQKIDIIYVVNGINEDQEIVILDGGSTPSFIDSENKKVCNTVNKPGSVYPVITQIEDPPVVEKGKAKNGVIIGIVVSVIVCVIIAVLIILSVVGVQTLMKRRRMKIINEAFQDDSISDI